jgi:predicted RNA-binding Zn ribbon-like protein
VGRPNQTTKAAFELTGGELCLDFANTVHNRPVPTRRQDRLTSYPALLAWGRQTSVLTARQARDLLHEATGRPAAASRVLRDGVKLREAIYRIFAAAASRHQPPRTDLRMLNAFVAEASRHLRIAVAHDAFRWAWTSRRDEALEQVLWPIARSAADVLTSDRLRSVRECEAEACGWLFLDNSHGQGRRWCDMRLCGNRAKVRRFYDRHRPSATRNV